MKTSIDHISGHCQAGQIDHVLFHLPLFG